MPTLPTQFYLVSIDKKINPQKIPEIITKNSSFGGIGLCMHLCRQLNNQINAYIAYTGISWRIDDDVEDE
jgi:hypothetical protein